jgi:hypothetical protein
MQRGLEVCLDLGIVRGKDAVSRVRGLTVDGLAALAPWSFGRGRRWHARRPRGT